MSGAASRTIRGRLGVGSIWSAGPGRKETHGERCLRDEHHDEGRPDSLRVARQKVRGNRAHEVDDQADGRRHAQDRPPYAKHQARCPRELAGSQDRKVLQGNAYRLVDYPDLAGIAANLPKGGKGGHAARRIVTARYPRASKASLLLACYSRL